jgi:hypothetical protein
MIVAVIDPLAVMTTVIEALTDVVLIMVAQDVMIIDVMIVMVVTEKNVVVTIFPRETNSNLTLSKLVIIKFLPLHIYIYLFKSSLHYIIPYISLLLKFNCLKTRSMTTAAKRKNYYAQAVFFIPTAPQPFGFL